MSYLSGRMSVLVMAGALTVLAGCAGADKPPEPTPDIGMAQPVGFKNVTEGYIVSYPQSWQTQVEEEDTALWQGKLLPAENVVVFNFIEDQSREKKPLMALAVYPQQQWNQLKKDAKPLPELIDTKGDRVLAAYIAPMNPYDPASPQGQAYAKRVLTPEQIKSAIVW